MDTLQHKPYILLPFTPFKPSSSPAIPTRSTNVIFSGFPETQINSRVKLCNLNRPNLTLTPQRLRRNFTVRSDVAATGNPEDAPFSITDVQLGSKVRAICFYTLSAIAVIPLFTVMALVHPFVLLFDRYRRRAHHLIARLWASISIAPFYRFALEGSENLPPSDAPVVYVSNHQSFLDIYTLLTLGGNFKFISKKSIFLIPVVGWAMYLMGMIRLRRMDRKSQLDCLRRSMDLLKKGASVFFFPEGTRSKDGKLGQFKKGAFSTAAKAEVPVVPIAVMGTGNLMPSGMEGVLNTGPVKVVVHKPISGSNADMLCSEARRVIADTLVHHGYGVHPSV